MNWMEWGRKQLWFSWQYYLDIWLRCLWKITKSAGQFVSWPDNFQTSVTANFSVAIFTLLMTLFGSPGIIIGMFSPCLHIFGLLRHVLASKSSISISFIYIYIFALQVIYMLSLASLHPLYLHSLYKPSHLS